MQLNDVYLRLIYNVNYQKNYGDMQHDFQKSHVDIISMLHVDIIMLHVAIYMWHVDIIYLACRGQKYATIFSTCVIEIVNMIKYHVNIFNQNVN